MFEIAVHRIVVGVDGSPASNQAVRWAAQIATALKAEVVAVFAVRPPPPWALGFGTPAQADPTWRAEIDETMRKDWCAPLAAARVKFRIAVHAGLPAKVISAVANEINADLVVIGRRDKGVAADVVMGSDSHDISLACHRPV
ncbi:MAG TPA: universal stress protein, partial [Candidatus Dormibacteraeota bacterium]|nr:universal stress protein [Candidatus Dormibacteraeota bacterium]